MTWNARVVWQSSRWCLAAHPAHAAQQEGLDPRVCICSTYHQTDTLGAGTLKPLLAKHKQLQEQHRPPRSIVITCAQCSRFLLATVLGHVRAIRMKSAVGTLTEGTTKGAMSRCAMNSPSGAFFSHCRRQQQAEWSNRGLQSAFCANGWSLHTSMRSTMQAVDACCTSSLA